MSVGISVLFYCGKMKKTERFNLLTSYNLLRHWTMLESVLEGCGKREWAVVSLGGVSSGEQIM